MSDLISREAAVKMLRDKARGYTVSMFATSSECNIARIVAAECAAEIKDMSAVDAEPVRHGRWEEYPDKAHLRCTNCRVEFDKVKMPLSRNFCPYCGAKME